MRNDYKTVSQVSGKYIHFSNKETGEQSRFTWNKIQLMLVKKELMEELGHIEYMIISLVRKSSEMEEKLKEILTKIVGYEKFIADNQDLPIVRRGLHSSHDDLKWANTKYTSLGNQLGGINSIYCECLDRKAHCVKVVNQIDKEMQLRG